MALFEVPNPIGVVMNVVDGASRQMGNMIGEANRWVASNSRDEPRMARDHYAQRKHQNGNIIPSGPSDTRAGERGAYIACRVVGGGALGGAASHAWNMSSLGTAHADANSIAPHPDHQWCVVVGGYLHQLQTTSLTGGHNYYTNERFNLREWGWKWHQISTTTYNDVAIRNAAVEVMNSMPENYDLRNNNCQTFTLRLLDRIIKDGRRIQLRGSRSYRLIAVPKVEPKASGIVVTRINEDGTETELDTDLRPIVGKRKPAKDKKAQPIIEVAEIDTDEEDDEVLNDKTKERILPLLDALKIMEQETPVIELRNDAAARINGTLAIRVQMLGKVN